MDYKSMIETAYKNGGGDAVMRKSVEMTNRLLETIKENNPDMYHRFIRDMYKELNGKHYNKEFAEEDVALLRFTDKEGMEHHGAHWTLEQIESATANKTFPKGTTGWDKYVAYNAAYADFCKEFTEEQILEIAWLFFFHDEDWCGDGKVWKYIELAQGK